MRQKTAGVGVGNPPSHPQVTAKMKLTRGPIMKHLPRGAVVLATAAAFLVACGAPTEPHARAKAHWMQCSPCHGDNGEGKRLQLAPPIAGLPAWYVEAQLNKYKEGSRGYGFDDLAGMRMRPMALSVTLRSETDIKELSAYVASLPTPPAQPAGIDGFAANGAATYAVCTACHQANGIGLQALNSPPIAGQPDWYIYEQLHKFKTGLRGADPRDISGGQMRAIALGLGDDKALHDLARYVADMPVVRPH